MTKELRRSIGIKKLRRQGLTYLQRAERIREFKQSRAVIVPKVKLSDFLPEVEVKRPEVVRVSFRRRCFTQVTRFVELLWLKLLRFLRRS